MIYIILCIVQIPYHFLRMAEEDGFVEKISKESPKSFVIAEVNKMSKVYLSPISSSTLTKRTNIDYNP